MKENLIVKHLAGSHAYGTSTPESDTDYRGVFCADPINLLTPFFPVREVEDETEEDTKLYELAHFMKLCLDCNPNVVETLWVDDSAIIAAGDAYDHLRTYRHELLSSKIAFTTSGYALAQLKRIKGHNKWINNPQSIPPPRQTDFVSLVQSFTTEKMMPHDFVLAKYQHDHRLIPYGRDIFGIFPNETGHQLYDSTYKLNTTFEGNRHEWGHPLFIVKWNKQEYKDAKERHQNYWSWKTNRNEKRGALEEEFGYDTKHAMHLVRLLRMGVEALRDEEIVVKRPDAEELLAIRNGAWTYDEVVAYAESMDKEVREVWYKKTKLRKRPDIHLAATLLMEVQEYVWK
jgi:hypothetical protein